MTSTPSKSDALEALETYGHDFSLWPDQDLASFVRSNPSFMDAVKDAAALDTALLGYKVPPPSDLLTRRILKAASGTPQIDFAQKTTGHISRPLFMRIAASLIACSVIGLGALHFHERNEMDAALIAEIETDALRRVANDLDMADIFLWVELDETAES